MDWTPQLLADAFAEIERGGRRVSVAEIPGELEEMLRERDAVDGDRIWNASLVRSKNGRVRLHGEKDILLKRTNSIRRTFRIGADGKVRCRK